VPSHSAPIPIAQGATAGNTSNAEMGGSQSDYTNTSGPAESQDFECGPLDGGDDREPSPPDSDQLRVRGTGEYTCHYGLSCKKGGVKDGKLKVFVRNSDFRYVCNC
jgi:hypothetical protein